MDEERVDEIFERIGDMDLELDYDPIERGPKFLNNMVAKCRNYTNEVQRFARECQMYLRVIERELRTKEAQFELEYNNLMANDPEIVQMRGLSRADREALANTKLQDEISEINELELELTDAKHVETVIESKLREFRDVNRDIRLQKQLIQAEIETGTFWGNDLEGQNTYHHRDGEVDADVDQLYENPDGEQQEGDSEDEDPNYEDLFVIDESKSEQEESGTPENSHKELDLSDQNDKVDQESSVTEDSDTGVFGEDYEDVEFDFQSALSNLG